MTDILYLSEKTLDGLGATSDQIIDSIEHLLRAVEQETAWSAPKSVLFPPDGRYIMATLAAADDPQLMAVKALILNPRNPERGFKGCNALVTLLDSETGVPLAVIDGNWVTAVRTAGLSAVAARRFARADACSIAFIGCGVQALSHLKVFAQMFPLREVHAFGRGTANRDALCFVAEEMGCSAFASKTAEDALRQSDIIVTSVTYSAGLEPFLDARWLKPGAFATITDLGVPWMDEHMQAFDLVIVDDLAQEEQMPNPLVPRDLIKGDLSALVHGRVPARENDEQRLAFAFRGLAVGDLALAGLAYRLAKEKSRGSAISD